MSKASAPPAPSPLPRRLTAGQKWKVALLIGPFLIALLTWSLYSWLATDNRPFRPPSTGEQKAIGRLARESQRFEIVLYTKPREFVPDLLRKFWIIGAPDYRAIVSGVDNLIRRQLRAAPPLLAGKAAPDEKAVYTTYNMSEPTMRIYMYSAREAKVEIEEVWNVNYLTASGEIGDRSPISQLYEYDVRKVGPNWLIWSSNTPRATEPVRMYSSLQASTWWALGAASFLGFTIGLFRALWERFTRSLGKFLLDGKSIRIAPVLIATPVGGFAVVMFGLFQSLTEAAPNAPYVTLLERVSASVTYRVVVAAGLLFVASLAYIANRNGLIFILRDGPRKMKARTLNLPLDVMLGPLLTGASMLALLFFQGLMQYSLNHNPVYLSVWAVALPIIGFSAVMSSRIVVLCARLWVLGEQEAEDLKKALQTK